MIKLLSGLLLASVAVAASACAIVPLGYPGPGPAVYAPGPPPVVYAPGPYTVYRPYPRRWYW